MLVLGVLHAAYNNILLSCLFGSKYKKKKFYGTDFFFFYVDTLGFV